MVFCATFKVMNGSVGIRGGEQWLGVQVRAQRSDSPPAGHVTQHPLWTAGRRDCCCLAAMTTNFESRMNGFSEEKEETRRLKSAPAVSEVHSVRGHSESKWLRRGAARCRRWRDVAYSHKLATHCPAVYKPHHSWSLKRTKLTDNCHGPCHYTGPCC